MTSGNRSLECGDAQLVFEYASERGWGYQINVREGSTWRPVSAPGNPLVRGSSFNLFPGELEYEDAATLRCAETKHFGAADGSSQTYAWTARIHADERRSWFHFEIEIDSPTDIRLNMVDGYEPEITVDLGLLPPYERGDHVWFKTSITNPTKWNDEAYGNDFPATCYYDPYRRLELLLFFDMTAMSWMSLDNIARFLNYRCGFRRRYRPQPAAEVGLYADGFSGHVFPAGRQKFGYWLSARHRGDGPEAPTEHQALQTLVTRALALLPAQSEWPVNATSWQDFSLNCARDMLDSEHCWGNDERGEYILNYVDGYSPAWREAIEARGRTFAIERPCLDAALWAAHPLSVLSHLEPAEEYRTLLARLLQFARPALRERHKARPAKAREDEVAQSATAGTWQYVYMLEEAWQVAMLQRDRELVGLIEDEAGHLLIPFARGVRHIFPLEFNKTTLRRHANGDCHAVAGLYAWFMLELHLSTGDEDYLEEAKAALRVNFHLPVNAVSQEVFLTAASVQAASRLHSLTHDEEFAEIYGYLLAQTLRQMYWYCDRTSAQTRDVNILGMFQACTPILYPAFFENIETLARLASTFKTHAPGAHLLSVFNHARKNNFYFFPRCLPSEYHPTSLQYIPLENIPILEGPEPSSVGQEIYGAGWTFRAYLLWEAFGRCEDRDIMMLNLDGFEERNWLESTRRVLTFIAYNPEAVAKRADLFFPIAIGSQAEVAFGRNPSEWSDTSPLEAGRCELSLQPCELVYLRLCVGPA